MFPQNPQSIESVNRNRNTQAWAKMVALSIGRPNRAEINKNDVEEIKRWNLKFQYVEQYIEMMKG